MQSIWTKIKPVLLPVLITGVVSVAGYYGGPMTAELVKRFLDGFF